MKTAEEEKKLAHIRVTYFPDIILNYLSALYYASLKLDRGLLTRNMEIAIVLAEDNHILDCFRKAGRLRELSDAMALASVAMVNAPAEAKTRKKTDGPARLDIWNIEVAQDNNGGRP
jgi:nuclear pore complex protein Nup107